MHKETHSSIRSPHSFEDVETFEISNRVLVRKEGDDDFKLYNPPTISINEFLDRFHDLVGNVLTEDNDETSTSGGRAEVYIDYETHLTVIRGYMQKPDNKYYYFWVATPFSNEIYEEVAKQTLISLKMSGTPIKEG